MFNVGILKLKPAGSFCNAGTSTVALTVAPSASVIVTWLNPGLLLNVEGIEELLKLKLIPVTRPCAFIILDVVNPKTTESHPVGQQLSCIEVIA